MISQFYIRSSVFEDSVPGGTGFASADPGKDQEKEVRIMKKKLTLKATAMTAAS